MRSSSVPRRSTGRPSCLRNFLGRAFHAPRRFDDLRPSGRLCPGATNTAASRRLPTRLRGSPFRPAKSDTAARLQPVSRRRPPDTVRPHRPDRAAACPRATASQPPTSPGDGRLTREQAGQARWMPIARHFDEIGHRPQRLCDDAGHSRMVARAPGCAPAVSGGSAAWAATVKEGLLF